MRVAPVIEHRIGIPVNDRDERGFRHGHLGNFLRENSERKRTCEENHGRSSILEPRLGRWAIRIPRSGGFQPPTIPLRTKSATMLENIGGCKPPLLGEAPERQDAKERPKRLKNVGGSRRAHRSIVFEGT